MQLLGKNRIENGVGKVGLSQRRQGKKDLGKRNSSSQKKESILEMKISYYDQLLQKMFQFIEDHLQLTAEEKQYLLDLTRPTKNKNPDNQLT